MVSVPDVVRLLNRADWTRLSLAAEVDAGIDPGLSRQSRLAAAPPSLSLPWLRRDEPEPEDLGGYRSERLKLLIAPGRRYREEYESAGWLSGCDGERRWDQDRPDQPGTAEPAELSGDPVAPLPGLLCPAPLLTGFILEVREPVTVAGRDAVHVVATPRPRLRDHTGYSHLGLDRIEAIVDTELGILLRRREIFQGQIVRLSQLTSLTLNPPEAADDSQFRAPPGSVIRESTREKQQEFYDQPSWRAIDLAAGGLGAWVKYSPFRSGDTPAAPDPEPGMPPDEPGPADPSPVSDDLLYLLYRSGYQSPELTATLHLWQDRAAVTSLMFPEAARARGHSGLASLVDAASEQEPLTHTMATVRTGSHGRYRIDYAVQPAKKGPVKAIADDGQRHRVLYQDRLVTGPSAPPQVQLADVLDASWLLECSLSGGTEIVVGNRRGYRISITRGVSPSLFLVFFPAEAVVDAELGVLLRLTCYLDGKPATRTELRDIGPGPVEPGVFRLAAPPGVRVVETSGDPLADMVAEAPGPVGGALRTTVGAAKRAGEAVTAVRSFLDGLRRQ